MSQSEFRLVVSVASGFFKKQVLGSSGSLWGGVALATCMSMPSGMENASLCLPGGLGQGPLQIMKPEATIASIDKQLICHYRLLALWPCSGV